MGYLEKIDQFMRDKQAKAASSGHSTPGQGAPQGYEINEFNELSLPHDRSKYPGAVLPFPLGFGGLPEKPVDDALAACLAAGIKDPIIIWQRVFRRVLDYMKQRGDTGPLYQRVLVRLNDLSDDNSPSVRVGDASTS